MGKRQIFWDLSYSINIFAFFRVYDVSKWIKERCSITGGCINYAALLCFLWKTIFVSLFLHS